MREPWSWDRRDHNHRYGERCPVVGCRDPEHHDGEPIPVCDIFGEVFDDLVAAYESYPHARGAE